MKAFKLTLIIFILLSLSASVNAQNENDTVNLQTIKARIAHYEQIMHRYFRPNLMTTARNSYKSTVDEYNELYMNAGVIRKKAIANMTNLSQEIMEEQGWNENDVDILVPHQTGNSILLELAKNLKIPTEKLFISAQKKYGNVSGATIPMSIHYLYQNNKIFPGQKLICPAVGVGGQAGVFLYIVPNLEILPTITPRLAVLGTRRRVWFDIIENLRIWTTRTSFASWPPPVVFFGQKENPLSRDPSRLPLGR